MPRTASAFLFFAMTALFSPCARAELAADASASIDRAYAAFQTRAALAHRQGTMPRLSVPADRAALDAMWDSKRLGAPPYGPRDVDAALDIVRDETAVLTAYATFKPVENGLPHKHYSEEFHDEVIAGLTAILRADIVVLASLDSVLVGLTPQQIEPRRQALLRLRASAMNQIISATRIIEDVTPSERTALTTTLAEGGPAIAASVTPEDRKALINAADSLILVPDPVTRRDLSRFMQALSITSCDRLCALR